MGQPENELTKDKLSTESLHLRPLLKSIIRRLILLFPALLFAYGRTFMPSTSPERLGDYGRMMDHDHMVASSILASALGQTNSPWSSNFTPSDPFLGEGRLKRFNWLGEEDF